MISSIKPLDTELVLTSTRRTEAIVTVEEHSTFGLGSAVATVFAASKRSSLRAWEEYLNFLSRAYMQLLNDVSLKRMLYETVIK